MTKRKEQGQFKLSPAQILMGIHIRELGLGEVLYEQHIPADSNDRFDICCPEPRILIECDGTFNGKHGVGWGKDNNKANTAQMLGWKVLRFDNKFILRGAAREWLKQWLS